MNRILEIETGFWTSSAIALAFALILLSTLPTAAFADEADLPEWETLQSMMTVRDAGDLVSAEYLLDWNGAPSFVIGYSDESYMIICRDSKVFLEQAKGCGPYSDDAVRKYYGGVGCYAQDCGMGLIDALSGKSIESVPFSPSVENLLLNQPTITSEAESEEQPATILKEVYLSNSNHIKSVAFGNNAGQYENTCTAVAMTIALDYLDNTYDSKLVEDDKQLELRTLSRYTESAFPNATSFHHYLVDSCGFDPRDILPGFTLGVWGNQVKEGLSSYLSYETDRSNVGLGIEWLLGSSLWIRESIDNDMPALITTTTDWWEDGTYEYHTMVAYGYRTMSDATMEANLHTGWYSSEATKSENGVYIMDDVWVNAEIATLTHKFSLSDGWHYSGSGDWKYYEDGSYVIGWKIIDGKKYYFNSKGVRTTGYLTIDGVRYLFDKDGILVSQSGAMSPLTGIEDLSGEDIHAQVVDQRAIQRTKLEDVHARLAEMNAENPDIQAWVYVPGISVNTPVAYSSHEEGYYLDHNYAGEDSTLGCVYMESNESASFDQPLTILYGHSFSNENLMFTPLHAFDYPDFFVNHEVFYIVTLDKTYAYRITEAADYTANHIYSMVDETDPASVQDYFDAFASTNTDFSGYRRTFKLDADTHRVVQLSTCTIPATSRSRFVVSGVLVGEWEQAA